MAAARDAASTSISTHLLALFTGAERRETMTQENVAQILLLEHKPDPNFGLILFGHSPYHWDVEALKDYTPWREDEGPLPSIPGDNIKDIPF